MISPVFPGTVLPGTVVPGLRYRDAPGAIDFLVRAFGFEVKALHADPADPSIVHHAQLVKDGGMVMLGSVRDDGFEAGMAWSTPAEAKIVTAVMVLLVADADAAHVRAVGAGARIVAAPHDNVGYPGRCFTASDPEGQVWCIDSYNPWA